MQDFLFLCPELLKSEVIKRSIEFARIVEIEKYPNLISLTILGVKICVSVTENVKIAIVFDKRRGRKEPCHRKTDCMIGNLAKKKMLNERLFAPIPSLFPFEAV